MRKTRAMSLLEACLVVPRGRHGDGHHLIRLQVLLDAACCKTLHIAHKCSAGNISMTPSLALCDNFIIPDVVKVCWNISVSTSYPSTPPQQQTTRPSLSSGWLRNKHWAAPKTNTDRTAAKLRYLTYQTPKSVTFNDSSGISAPAVERLCHNVLRERLPAPEHPHVNLAFPSVKVTPDSQSTPASATISPAPAFPTTKSYKIRVKNGHNDHYKFLPRAHPWSR